MKLRRESFRFPRPVFFMITSAIMILSVITSRTRVGSSHAAPLLQRPMMISCRSHERYPAKGNSERKKVYAIFRNIRLRFES